MFEFETVFFLFQLIVRASSRKKRSQTTRLSNQPEVRQRTATLHNKPASAPTTAQRNHAEHPLSAVRKCAALRETEVYNAGIPCSFPVRLLVRHTRSKTYHTDGHQHELQNRVLAWEAPVPATADFSGLLSALDTCDYHC